MALEITGLLNKLLPEERGAGANGEWVKRNFVIETRENYPKKICFAAWGERAAQMNQYREGMELKVSFDPQSREYNGRWYTDLKAWKIEAVGGASSGSAPADPSAMGQSDYIPKEDFSSGADEDLPF